MKLGQIIEYNKINIFLKNYAENEAGETSYRPLFFKSLIRAKSKRSAA